MSDLKHIKLVRNGREFLFDLKHENHIVRIRTRLHDNSLPYEEVNLQFAKDIHEALKEAETHLIHIPT